jgi:hypothetical protein
MGPFSPIWEAYLWNYDSEYAYVNYAISLAKTSAPAPPTPGPPTPPTTLPASNITIGGYLPLSYSEGPKISFSSAPGYNSSAIYNLEYFAFGIVYQTNGADSSESF